MFSLSDWMLVKLAVIVMIVAAFLVVVAIDRMCARRQARREASVCGCDKGSSSRIAAHLRSSQG
jgi:hypothetical protein